MRLGLNPLENARTELPHFDLAGVNDVAGEDEGQGPDFARALGDRDRARACVLLAHQPVQIHDAVDHGVDLQLSGHTHGGQLWPGNLIARGANPTVAGLDRYGDTQLYVSRGAGCLGPAHPGGRPLGHHGDRTGLPPGVEAGRRRVTPRRSPPPRTAGSVTVTLSPSPGAVSTVTSPPCARTTPCTIAGPSPLSAPPPARKKRSKTRDASSGARPGPSSVIHSRTSPRSRAGCAR